MKLFKITIDFIIHYGITMFLHSAWKTLLREVSLLKFRWWVHSGKVYSPDYIYKNLNQTNQSVFKLPRLNFEENIKAIKKNNLYRKKVDQIIAEADKFYDNTFNILGSGWIKWENHGKIAWHTDIKSNYTFKKLYYKSMKREIKKEIRDSQESLYDLMVPRNLSRFYFLFGLYFSYIYSGDERFINKIKALIENWIDENPPFYGINWSNAMEAAIRISNWCTIIYALKSALLKDQSFAEKFYISLYQHNLFIRHNLEKLILINNHYISQLTGIIISNMLFPIFKKSNKWTRWASGKISHELIRSGLR